MVAEEKLGPQLMCNEHLSGIYTVVEKETALWRWECMRAQSIRHHKSVSSSYVLLRDDNGLSSGSSFWYHSSKKM